MSLVDLGKSLHRRLTDATCRHRIVFHHVPKCGGTSVGRTLRRAYILSQGTVTPDESAKAFEAAGAGDANPGVGSVLELRQMMLLYLLYSDTRCVSAHIPFSDVAFDRFHDRYAFITLLRDPVERFVSHYYWSHKRPEGHGHIAESFEDFLNSDRARTIGSTYARYFCGYPAAEGTPAIVSAAVRNLRRMDHVGFLDQMGDFEAGLRRVTGKSLSIGRENVGRTGSKTDAIMQGPLRQKVLDVTVADRDIWDAVQDLRRQPAGAANATELAPAGGKAAQ